MPIYCYKCQECGEVLEKLCRLHRRPSAIRHYCPAANNNLIWAQRYIAGEIPRTHTQGTYRFTPHFDPGAGRAFDNKAEYTAWQRANADRDGVMPEPVEGKRKVALYEEAGHACHINKQVQVDEKAERAALGKAFDDAHNELAACDRLGVKYPSL